MRRLFLFIFELTLVVATFALLASACYALFAVVDLVAGLTIAMRH